jgi:hypothetical protein
LPRSPWLRVWGCVGSCFRERERMTTRETLKAIHERGDLLPWLNGETECIHYQTGANYDNAEFRGSPSVYTFRPKPAPPKLRAWTWDEFWPHRDAWFSKSGCTWTRIERIDTPTAMSRLYIHDRWIDLESLSKFKYLDTDGTWKPCGVFE